MKRIKKKIRINTLLASDLDLDIYFKRWSNILFSRVDSPQLSLRADYRFIDFNNLKSMTEPGFILVSSHPKLTYLGSGGCTVCNDDSFLYREGDKCEMAVSYHRGIESSCVDIGNQRIVNDIIIKNDGGIAYDWDGKNENINYLNQTLFNHYTLIDFEKNESPKKLQRKIKEPNIHRQEEGQLRKPRSSGFRSSRTEMFVLCGRGIGRCG